MSTVHAFDDARLEPPDDYYEDELDGEPCEVCGGTGEVSVDVETPSGQVREHTYPCGCGSDS